MSGKGGKCIAAIGAIATLITAVVGQDGIKSIWSSGENEKIDAKEVVLVDNSAGDLNLPVPTKSVEARYICGKTKDGKFATTAQTSNRNIILIKWTKDISDDWTPSSRCQKVSERFQYYKEQGVLNYLTTGRINREDVVCVAASNGDCNRQQKYKGLLFTITSSLGKSNPGEVLINLMNLASSKNVPPINETTSRVYIDINKLLKSKTSQSSKIPDSSTSKEDSSECFDFGCNAQPQ